MCASCFSGSKYFWPEVNLNNEIVNLILNISFLFILKTKVDVKIINIIIAYMQYFNNK